MSKTKHLTNGPIARTNRFFIQLKGYGHCDDNGKTILGVGQSGKKLIARPDQPLCTLIYPILTLWMEALSYSSDEAIQADLKKFQSLIADWEVKKESGVTPK